jgi:hypothetical protein
MMLEEKALVNVRLLDNWLNLSEIYFKLFFGFDIGFIRPTAISQIDESSMEHIKPAIMSQRVVGAKLLPEGFRDPTK